MNPSQDFKGKSIDAVTFVASITMLTWVPSQKPPPGEQVSRFEAVKEGLRFALGKRLLRAIFLVDLAAMIFGMPRALFPELADEVFGIGAAGVGILYSAPALGALIGAMFSGWVNNVSKQGPAIFIAVGGWGVAITLAGVALPNLALTLTFLAIAGAADVLSAVFRGTLLHQSTPDSLRGRGTSVNTLATVGGPRLGAMEAGTAAALMGLRGSFVFGGVTCLVVTALIAFRYPELRRFERSERPAPRRGESEDEPRLE